MLDYKQLVQTENQSQDIIRQHVAYLVDHYSYYLPALMMTLQTGSKDEFEIPAMVMEEIGYPANVEAVPYLLDDFLYGMSPSENVSLQALVHMPPEVLIPYLIEVLWARQSEPRWRHLADGAIYLLGDKLTDGLSARICLPVVCGLILQGKCPRLDSALKCFARVPPVDRSYAVPTLLYLQSHEANPNIRSEVQALMGSYPSEILQPYVLAGKKTR